MKKWMLFLFAYGLFFSVSGQKVEVSELPNGVARVFKISYPEAFNVFWQKTENTYIADFTQNEAKAKAFFGVNGDLLSTEWSVPIEYLPKKIKTNITERYKGFKIKQVDMVRKATDSENHYRLILSQKKNTQTIMYNLKGEPIKEEEKKP